MIQKIASVLNKVSSYDKVSSISNFTHHIHDCPRLLHIRYDIHMYQCCYFVMHVVGTNHQMNSFFYQSNILSKGFIQGRFDENHSEILLPHCSELLESRNLSFPHEQTYLSFRSWHVSNCGHRPSSRLARYCELMRVQEPYSSILLSHSGSILTNYI